MTVVRLMLGLCGIALVGYGAVLVWENPPVIITRILVWAVVAVVVHDFVFAPLCVAVGFAGRRLIPAGYRSPVAVAVLCSVVLALLAIPVYGRPGMRPDNMTVLDRNYPLGLWVSLGVVWLSVLLYSLVTRFLPVRQDDVVEHQRADDVERHPPAV
jgi:phosphatidylglycerophosphate synthase